MQLNKHLSFNNNNNRMN